MKTKRWVYASVMAVGFALLLTASQTMKAGQQSGEAGIETRPGRMRPLAPSFAGAPGAEDGTWTRSFGT